MPAPIALANEKRVRRSRRTAGWKKYREERARRLARMRAEDRASDSGFGKVRANTSLRGQPHAPRKHRRKTEKARRQKAKAAAKEEQRQKLAELQRRRRH